MSARDELRAMRAAAALGKATRWRVTWVERHEMTLDIDTRDDQTARELIWAKLATLGVSRDDVTACYCELEPS